MGRRWESDLRKGVGTVLLAARVRHRRAWRPDASPEGPIPPGGRPRTAPRRGRSPRGNRFHWFAAVAAVLVPAAAGCGGTSRPAAGPSYGTAPASAVAPVYRFAVQLLFNPTRLLQAYQPLIDRLNGDLGSGRLTLEASRDYAAFEEKYRARQPDFILANPWQTLQAMKVGYRVIAQAGDPADFKGIFIVRKDGAVARPADLRGKTVSYPSATALAACIMPQYFLHEHGVDVVHDIRNTYVGSQESSIMNAYLGLAAAGATWPPPWRVFQRERAREAAELTVAGETESLINNSVMARDDVPDEVRGQVRALPAGMTRTGEGRAALARAETSRFSLAVDRDYAVVDEYVARFEREVRKVGPG